MEFTKMSVETLLSAIEFETRNFQQDYYWSQHEWETLWNTINCTADAISDDDDYDDVPNSFLGHIVCRRMWNNGIYTRYCLIDGMQRILTLCIILAVCRDKIKIYDPEKANDLKEHLSPDLIKFLPKLHDREYFNNLLTESTDPMHENHPFALAYQYYYSMISSPEIFSEATLRQKFIVFFPHHAEEDKDVFKRFNSPCRVGA